MIERATSDKTVCEKANSGKLKRKFSRDNAYQGRVGATVITLGGRTKREATKRLRLAFSRRGVQTQPNAITDLLEVTGPL